MLPVKFDGMNVTYAESQPQYEPLPALKLNTENGEVISCWRMGFWERIQVLFTGRVWLSMYTFNRPLQPVKLATTCPFVQIAPVG